MSENRKRRNIWADGILGVVVGDAMGCPVQFRSREEIAGDPVTGMRGYGTYNMPPGTWTDDSSMTLALLSGIRENQGIDLRDTMERFKAWLVHGEYTPFGESFDIGGTTMDSVSRYISTGDAEHSGGRGEHDNGNGSLMRIMPACLYCYEKQTLGDPAGRMSEEEAIGLIHRVSGLTHNHARAKVACGIYYFLVREILEGKGRFLYDSPKEEISRLLMNGMDAADAFYTEEYNWENINPLHENYQEEFSRYYERVRWIFPLSETPREMINSSGYVVDSLEAAVWSLLQASSFKESLLCAVNLGGDTDTIGAICGGLAGLYYGREAIPAEWIEALQRREWVEGLCEGVIR